MTSSTKKRLKSPWTECFKHPGSYKLKRVLPIIECLETMNQPCGEAVAGADPINDVRDVVASTSEEP